MRSILHSHSARLEFCILDAVKPLGRPLGRFGDKEFSEAVVDAFGRRLTFAGIAPRTANGGYDEAALRDREFIVPPGLIYRYD